MPIYDYQCQSCGHRVEVMHGVNDQGPGACDRCGGQMRKLLSPPAIVFRGSGWAKKDARAAKPGAAKASSGDSDAAVTKKDGESASAGKTEAGSTGKADSGSGDKSTAASGGSSGT
jgi:putative FmdB family regulatory protein